MEIKEFKRTRKGIYHVEPNCINIIQGRKGKIVFPDMESMCQLQIIFMSEGEFELSAHDKEFKIGSMIGKIIKHKPGQPGYDTQPSFVYAKDQECWVIISIGIIDFKEQKELSDQCLLPC